ncbi:MAG TPA: response regulator [Ramlibacter sp.]|nr:response regulator [Ramlibacter sp.]
MTSEKSAERVFVKVVGFTDMERHALNTVFRLSEQRPTAYSLWLADAPAAPRLALIDGQSYEARLELEAAHDPELKLIWVGAVAPANAWRTFQRPLSWSHVLSAMDEVFTRRETVDFDLAFDSGIADTRPHEPGRRALIASADRSERLYLRAKLALAELTQVDEAETGAQALELARVHRYAVAVVDFALPDVNGWAFLKELNEARPAIPHVIITKAKASAGERVRAWIAGARGCFDKPPHPGKLQDLLQKVQETAPNLTG